MAFKYAIALTGGIASGKSSVGAYFRTLGWEVLNADKVAHTMLNRHANEIASLFGKEMLHNGKIDRQALGAQVFRDKEKRKRLESFLHPLIYEALLDEANRLDEKRVPYLIELPLFFETNRYPIERSLLVYVPKEVQLSRLMQRDALSKEEAKLRLDAQMDIELKRQKATYVIENLGTKEALYQSVEALKHQLEGVLNDRY
jgi:dephospho-CoA kinase